MLQNLLQYPPQGLMAQFTGLQTPGFPQAGPGLFGQPSLYGINGQAQSPFNGQAQSLFATQQFPYPGQVGAWPQNPLLQSAFAQTPYLQSLPQTQIVQGLVYLAQQMLTQGALIQQIGIALHQLCQQLVAQSLQAPQSGFAGQPFGMASPLASTQPFSAAGQSFWQPLAGTPAAQAYGGIGMQVPFSPQAGFGWGAGRPPTIQ
jgi:hypothetical protein